MFASIRAAARLHLLVVMGALCSCAPDAPAPAPPTPPTGDAPAVVRVEATPLRIAGQYPLPGDVYRGEAILYFDRPVLLPEDPGEWVDVSPDFEATVTAGEQYLRVQGDVSAGETVRLTLTDAVVGQDGSALTTEDRTVRWGTVTLKPTNLAQAGGTRDHPVLSLYFTAPVDAAGLSEFLTVRDADGNDVPAEVEAVGEKLARLSFLDPPALPVVVSVAAGVRGADGVTRSREAAGFTYPVTGTLTVQTPRWWGRDEGRRVVLTFSRGVKEEALEEHLRVTRKSTGAPLAYALEALDSGDRYVVTLLNPPNDAFVAQVDLEMGLPAEDGAVLGAPKSFTLVHRVPMLAVENVYWRQGVAEGFVAEARFNHSLDAEGLEEHFRVTPAVTNLKIDLKRRDTVNLTGEWDSDTEYTLHVEPGYRDADGNALKTPIAYSFRSYQIPGYLGFDFDEALYFPRRGDGALPVITRNVDRVTHTVYRLFSNNFVAALEDLRENDFYQLRQQWAEELSTGTVLVKGTKDRMSRTVAPLDQLLPDNERGLFLLEAQGDQGHNAFKLMVHTDLGLLAHWEDDQLVAYVHDLFTLLPAVGAKVSLYSHKNQFLAEAVAGPAGKVELGGWNAALGTPTLLTASLENDFTYLDLQRRNDSTPAEAGAHDPYRPDAYDAFLYADRNLYRPGETAHLRWLVRRGYTEAPAGVPLKLTVYQPNGAEILSAPVTLNDRGTGGYDIVSQKTWPTGAYACRLTVPGEHRALGSFDLNIEEFVPNQIEVDVNVPEPHLLAGRECEVNVKARHLFGAPAGGRVANVFAVLSPGAFRPAGFEGYVFSHEGFRFQDRIGAGERDTDEAGGATFALAIPEDTRMTQPLRAQIVAEVFEEGGRPVTKTADRMLFADEIVPGLKARIDGEPGEVVVDIAALRPDGTPAGLDVVTVTLERRDWSYYVRRYYDHHSPNFTPRYDTLERHEVSLADGRGRVAFDIEQWGNYRVRVHSDKTPLYATRSFYHSGYYTTLVEEDAPSLVSVKLDREAYDIGDTARVVLEAPFQGRAVVVLQNHAIQDLHTVAFVEGKADLEVPIASKHFPNFWVEVTAVYAPEPGKTQMHPFSSFGMAHVPVNDPNLQVAVSFPDLPASVRPAQTHVVTLEATVNGAPAANAELTLAAVDAGILNITGFASPDPYPWLTRPRYPDLRRTHYYDKVGYDYLKTPIGGDAAALAKRLGDDMQNWIETVALWSGAVVTDDSGRVDVPVDLPEFNGRIRLMAVASTVEGAVGAGDAPLLVKRPYIMRPSLPRFVDPEDTFDATLTLFNNSTEPVSIQWRAVAGGQLVESDHQGTLALDAESETTLRVAVAASSDSGPGEVAFSAEVRGEDGTVRERLARTMALPVRVPAVWQQERALVIVPPGETAVLENGTFREDAKRETRLTLSAMPGMQLFEALDDLIRYPYGCLEQTTSQLMPMYLLRQSPIAETLAGKEVGNIENFLRGGVDRLLAMQTGEGGLAMWRGGQVPYPYGTIYAAHLLTLIRRDKVIELPDESFRLLQQYAWKVATGDAGRTGHYAPNETSGQQLQRAYALFVLALGGNLEALKRIEGLNPTEYPRTARYLLAAALAMNNPEHPAIDVFLTDIPNEMVDTRTRGGTLNSRARNEAMELLCKTYLDVPDEEKALLAERLIRWLKDQRWGSTQEKAFVVTALGTYFGEVGRNLDQTFAVISGPDGDEDLRGAGLLRQAYTGPVAPITVKNTGATTLYADFATAGVPRTLPTEPISEGLYVGRALTDLDGNPVAGALRQGAVYRMVLTLKPDSGLENVVVADLLPAGLEVENARLSEVDDADEPRRGSHAEYIDLRDDRVIVAYRWLAPKTTTYAYTVRAVTPGTFTHPPVTAECMYDPAIRAFNLPNKITVEAR